MLTGGFPPQQSLIRSVDLHERLCMLNNNMFKFLNNTWKMQVARPGVTPEIKQEVMDHEEEESP